MTTALVMYQSGHQWVGCVLVGLLVGGVCRV